jgi:hypothetical protein
MCAYKDFASSNINRRAVFDAQRKPLAGISRVQASHSIVEALAGVSGDPWGLETKKASPKGRP